MATADQTTRKTGTDGPQTREDAAQTAPRTADLGSAPKDVVGTRGPGRPTPTRRATPRVGAAVGLAGQARLRGATDAGRSPKAGT